MGKKSAHTGMSPKDRSINIMDKFISKGINKEKNQPFKSARRKDPDVPLHMWPLKDQIEYWDTRTEDNRFDELYPVYSYWIAAVQKECRVHSSFFNDKAIQHKTVLLELYANKTSVKDTVAELRKLRVY